MNYCIVDSTDKEITEKLTKLGYTCIDVVASDRVSPSICRHSDVLYKKLNSNTIIVSSCQKANIPILEKLGYTVLVTDLLQPGYKTECLLNYVINDSYYINNPDTALKPDDIYLDNKIEIIVKQGYTNCSTICLTSSSYITDDKGIYKKLIKNNCDCLLIPKGDIQLPGYNYGFIGGASVKLKENIILFFGDIQNTKIKKEITEFLNKYNFEPRFIENKILKDIGSAVIL